MKQKSKKEVEEEIMKEVQDWISNQNWGNKNWENYITLLKEDQNGKKKK